MTSSARRSEGLAESDGDFPEQRVWQLGGDMRIKQQRRGNAARSLMPIASLVAMVALIPRSCARDLNASTTSTDVPSSEPSMFPSSNPSSPLVDKNDTFSQLLSDDLNTSSSSLTEIPSSESSEEKEKRQRKKGKRRKREKRREGGGEETSSRLVDNNDTFSQLLGDDLNTSSSSPTEMPSISGEPSEFPSVDPSSALLDQSNAFSPLLGDMLNASSYPTDIPSGESSEFPSIDPSSHLSSSPTEIPMSSEPSVSSNPSTPPEKKPNILLLTLDQWRYDWDGQHQRHRKADPSPKPIPLQVPFLDGLANRGTRFSQAYVPSPTCATSRACVAAGKEYDDSGVFLNSANLLPCNTTTFYKLLRDEAGYHIMTTGKDDLYQWDENFMKGNYRARPPKRKRCGDRRRSYMDLGFSDAIRMVGKRGMTKEETAKNDPYRNFLQRTRVMLDDQVTRVNAFDVYLDCFTGNTGKDSMCQETSFTEENYPDTYVAKAAMKLLERKPDDVPWFLSVNFLGPHPPYMATAAMARSVADRKWSRPVDSDDSIPLCRQQAEIKEGILKSIEDVGPRTERSLCDYAALIEHIDSLMGDIEASLENSGELNNTIICVVGDHGELLGEHNLHGKNRPWQPSVSVPLICAGPGIAEGGVHNKPVGTLDLGGTFMDFAGISKPPEYMSTQSLRPALDGSKKVATRDFVSSGFESWRIVVKHIPRKSFSYKLICCQGKCPDAPASASPVSKKGWNILLYNIMTDPFEMRPLEDKLPDIVEEMLPLLPDGWCDGSRASNLFAHDSDAATRKRGKVWDV